MAEQNINVLVADVEAIAARVKAKKSESKPVNVPTMPDVPAVPIAAVVAAVSNEINEVMAYPSWGDDQRGVPNFVLRSALFGAIRPGRRADLYRQSLACYEGITIAYTGKRLDQADLDVWEYCLQLSRNVGSSMIRFSLRTFLSAIDRNTGQSDREWLEKVLYRLMCGVVDVKVGSAVYAGQLLHHFVRDEQTSEAVVVINPTILALFKGDNWTAIEWEDRLKLKRQPLALWLHGFYSSHAAPYPLKVDTIHRLCGSETAQMFHFRAELRKACEKLAEATKWTWKIDRNDLLHIDKSANRPVTQSKHIVRKLTAKPAKPKR